MFKITLVPFGNVNSKIIINEGVKLNFFIFLYFFYNFLMSKNQNKILLKVMEEL